VKAAAEILGKAIDESGWLSTARLAEIAAEEGVGHEELHQAIRLLDRKKAITARKGPDDQAGWESLLGKGSRPKRYGGLSTPITVRMVFETAPLGQISENGTNFMLLRDTAKAPVFVPAQFRAMLTKAYRLSGLAADETMSETAVSRVYVRYVGSHVEGTTTVIRRPLNAQRQAVGECIHEALAPGSWLEWTIAFPVSHFTEETAQKLLDTCETVGFTPAGCGRSGGRHGLFHWEPPSSE
jgi:hypothetical protein